MLDIGQLRCECLDEIDLFWFVIDEGGRSLLCCQTEDEAIKAAEGLVAKSYKRVFVLQPIYCVEANGTQTRITEM